MKVMRPALLFGLLVMSPHGFALDPWKPTPAEMSSLPAYCAPRLTQNDPVAYKNWLDILGPGYKHAHHYCAATNFVARAYRARSAQEKKFNLGNARTNYNYMLTHTDASSPFHADSLLGLANVAKLTGNKGEALGFIQRAQAINPKLPQIYNQLADYYAETGQTAKALEAVTEGLKWNPDTSSLQRRYRNFGGKLPYPEAHAAVRPADAPQAPSQEAPVAEPTAESTADPVAATASATTPETASSSPDTPAPRPRPVLVEPKIGSPDNPYCRFCP
jgi:tetratricopeptide (TPR) repeat protein